MEIQAKRYNVKPCYLTQKLSTATSITFTFHLLPGFVCCVRVFLTLLCNLHEMSVIIPEKAEKDTVDKGILIKLLEIKREKHRMWMTWQSDRVWRKLQKIVSKTWSLTQKIKEKVCYFNRRRMMSLALCV